MKVGAQREGGRREKATSLPDGGTGKHAATSLCSKAQACERLSKVVTHIKIIMETNFLINPQVCQPLISQRSGKATTDSTCANAKY